MASRLTKAVHKVSTLQSLLSTIFFAAKQHLFFSDAFILLAT